MENYCLWINYGDNVIDILYMDWTIYYPLVI